MTRITDREANVTEALHPFTKAGMGDAPFRFCGVISLPSLSLAETNPFAYQAMLREIPKDVPCGTCNHCGAGILNNYVVQSADGRRSVVGCDCIERIAENDPELARVALRARNAAEKKRRAERKMSKQAVEAESKRKRAEALLVGADLTAAWAIWAAGPQPGEKYEERVIGDIVAKLVQFGDISTKALAYLKALVEKIAARVNAPKEVPATPFPTDGKRQTVKGEVLTVKSTDWGLKLLVKTAGGWKAWGSLPRTLAEGATLNRGDTVQFDATLIASRDDPSFGFFKLPTKAQIVNQGDLK